MTITLATLSKATAMEVFTQVKEGLLAQGRSSRDANHHCMYRGEGGCKCAGGFLIADEEYEGDPYGRVGVGQSCSG